MVMVDYSSIPNVNDRIVQAVKDMLEAGVSKPEAQSIVAVSVRESSCLWQLKRESTLSYATNECWAFRLLVGFEPSDFVYKRDANGQLVLSNGQRIIDQQVIPGPVAKDADAVNWLQSKGLIADGSYWAGQGRIVDPKSPPYFVAKGALLIPGHPIIAAFFEWVVGMRKAALLTAFSIGPTMMYMRQSKMAADALGSGYTEGWPKTWDELFEMYMKKSSILPYFSYLGHGKPGAYWPAADPDNDPANIAWLRNQTGGAPNRAENYYILNYGSATADRNTGYHGVLWRVINLTKGT
jgi:hypothetical protein